MSWRFEEECDRILYNGTEMRRDTGAASPPNIELLGVAWLDGYLTFAPTLIVDLL
jgi:hypothetical protein